MRILRGLVGVALSLAWPICAGCSGGDPGATPGTGGASAAATGDSPPFEGGSTGVVSSVGSGVVPGFRAKSYGDAEDQTASALAVNAAGESALVGTARGTVDFGNLPWPGSKTDTDVVVAKVSSNGQSLWSRRYGDSCDQRGGAVAHTPSGGVFLAGDFCGKMDFGTTVVTTAGPEIDLFVAVIDTLGEDVYSRSFGGKGAQIARAAAVDQGGNAILVGSFDQAFDDGTGAAPSAGLDDAFVIKLDPAGKVLWSQRFGGPESDLPRAVAVDPGGDIVVGGSFGGTVDFGGGPFTAPQGHPSAFVIRLDPGGKLLWTQTFASDDAVVNGIAIGDNGVIAVAGSFAGSVNFEDGIIQTAGQEDAFVARLDGTGKIVWGRAFGGPASNRGLGVAFGAGGALALVGTSDEPIDFGNFGLGAIAPNGPGMAYVAIFNSSSSIAGGWALGSTAPLQIVGIGLTGKADVTVAGSFEATIGSTFGTLPSAGGQDMFLVHVP
jgi:hypothetical protein